MNILDLNSRKLLRLFEGMLELQLSFVAGGAHGQFQFDVSGDLLGLDADDAHAAREDALEVHEHERPIEAAGVEDGIDEISAIMQFGDVLAVEKCIQVPALRFEPGHLLAGLLRAGTQLGVEFAYGIDVPTQSEEGETG